MASAAKSDFPQFLDGDVLLVVSTTQTYKLHSQVLSTHSVFFAQEIAAKPPPRLNAQARRDRAAAYRFEYVTPFETGEIGKWVRKDVNEHGRIPRASASAALLPDFDNGKVANNTYKAWDWLFGIFYNREPSFVNDALAKVIADISVLIECAESVGSIDHVRDVVDLALLRQDIMLWSSILGNPVAWLELGRRVRSPTIFSEAAIHLIGQWGTLPEDDKLNIPDDLRDFLEHKANELDLAKEAIELRILGHYPQFMLRTAADKPGRPSYSSDIYMWMAVCFFRQWFAQSISDDRTRRAPDGGLNFYTALYEGGQAYLTHLDFQEFHRYFPMSIKACHVLEANMGVLKEDVKNFVSDLMVECTHLKRDDYPAITWLTCAKIDKDDLPWHIPTPKGKDDQLQTLYNQLDDENNTLAEQARQKQKKAGAVAAATSPPVARTTPAARTPARPRKRARIIEDDGDDDDDFDDVDDGSGMFIPERRDDVMADDDDEEE
ncbi:hypothetical protein A1O3_08140 [Capronia epimyces CBS 606.96]|uniref:BTB domain-containing protein n=1 Tax=Capronia epimyces CBS 606.96 TaxID=1182542 RepID=W9XRB6_9EURO|nr:uncharacterized protein A1O3_08140 [Capronia epimyces CBS 606.96]EXJ79855.1 hypothetical protein A1O3_08140 [Capronia epimyces CBS 606.96]